MLFSGNVYAPLITNSGTGYTIVPIVTIDPPTSEGIQATAIATISSGGISSIIITNPGSGYNTIPNIVIATPNTTGIRATATVSITPNDYVTLYNAVDPWRVKTNRIVDATLELQKRGTIISAGTSVTNVTVISGGTGYDSGSTITFSAPPTDLYFDINSNYTINNLPLVLSSLIQQTLNVTVSVYSTISVGDTVLQGTASGKVTFKNLGTLIISVLTGTFTTGVALIGATSTNILTVSTIHSASATVQSYDTLLQKFSVSNVIGTFNTTDLVSVTLVNSTQQFIQISQIDEMGVTATGTLILNSGSIIGVNIINPGLRYITPPTITLGGNGSAASLSAVLDPQPNSFLIFDGIKFVGKDIIGDVLFQNSVTYPSKIISKINRPKMIFINSYRDLY